MKSVWVRIISCITAILLSVTLFATSPTAFENAKQQLVNMLDGKDSLSYEKAIFIIENAYYNNQLIYADFTENLDFNTVLIKELANTQKTVPAYKADYFYQYARQTPEQYKQDYRKAVLNWAIFTYLTDTTLYRLDSNTILLKLPYTYPTTDPMGTADWTNTQVLNVLNNGKGNCFALASLFKIFSDRLNTNVSLCTAPNHIYIRHEDDKGTRYNIDVANAAFPGSGTMQTLTYSTDDAIKNNIALRTLNTKQAVALCLVYLAKGYEYKTGIKSDAFMLQCAETALQYDSLNLNAMLLQAELLEHTLQQKNKNIAQLQTDAAFKQYEKIIAKLYRLGYREMPSDMKNLLVNGWTKDTTQLYLQNNLAQNKNETRKASLSWGMFDEEHKYKPTEQYGNTLFDCKTKKIKGFSNTKPIYNDYNFDPVVFAWNIDPLTANFPGMSPYMAFADNPIYYIDVKGLEPIKNGATTLSNMLTSLKDKNISNLTDLRKFFGSGYGGSGGTGGAEKKYLYSSKWGWVDMRHMSFSASSADGIGTTYSTLGNGEHVEYRQENLIFPNNKHESKFSAWDYEDLVSNLIGVGFELYLDADDGKGKDIITNLNDYLTTLGFDGTDYTIAENYKTMPQDYKKEAEQQTSNSGYEPKYAPNKNLRTSKWDKKLLEIQKNQEKGEKNRRDNVYKQYYNAKKPEEK